MAKVEFVLRHQTSLQVAAYGATYPERSWRYHGFAPPRNSRRVRVTTTAAPLLRLLRPLGELFVEQAEHPRVGTSRSPRGIPWL
jgi:hypothetical protein